MELSRCGSRSVFQSHTDCTQLLQSAGTNAAAQTPATTNCRCAYPQMCGARPLPTATCNEGPGCIAQHYSSSRSAHLSGLRCSVEVPVANLPLHYPAYIPYTSVPVFMILAALWAACQDYFGQNPDRIEIFRRVSPRICPEILEKCTTVRISRPEGTEIMSGQNFSPNKTGTLPYTMPLRHAPP